VKQEPGVQVKREFCPSPVHDGEIEFVSERPAKRRCGPTENDEVIDLE
jgi:hypothetical protein